jgi:hypothetical protein
MNRCVPRVCMRRDKEHPGRALGLPGWETQCSVEG